MTQEKKLTTILERTNGVEFDPKMVDLIVDLLDLLFRDFKVEEMNWERVLYSRDFAEVYFGKHYWMGHLQQAIVDKDPIDYIFNNFKTKKEVTK
jgi:hypothetical protein